MATEQQALIGSSKETDIEKGKYPHQQEVDQVRLAKLGVFGIIRESIKCYSKHVRYFSRITFSLGIPILLYLIFVKVLDKKFLIRPSSTSPQVASQQQLDRTGIAGASASTEPNVLADHINQWWTILFLERNFEVWSNLFWKAIPILAIWLSSVLLNLFCQVLWDSGTIFTVGVIYCRPSLLIKNSPVAYLGHVLRKTPRLVNRTLRTCFWTTLLLTIDIFAFMVSFAVIIVLRLNLPCTLLLHSILLISFLVCTVAIATLSTVAEGVAILDPVEGSSGLVALKKARALLKGKWKVAVGVVFIWVLIVLLIGLVQPAPFASNLWDPIRLLVIFMTCTVTWVVSQISLISVGVLYVSLKAFHGESVGELEMEEETNWTCISGSAGKGGLAGADLRYLSVSV